MDDSILFQASIPSLSKMMSWIETKLQKHSVENKKGKHILLALEEGLVNIIYHAYQSPAGLVEIQVSYCSSTGELEFKLIDQGTAFDPLKYQKLDISSNVEDRRVGGLGIFFMKKVSDSLIYERVNDSNVLTFRNKIDIKKV